MRDSVLFVDDDEDVRYLLSRFLAQAGFVVHSASNGLEALKLLDRINPPAVILLDYKMPIMNGAEFLAAIRNEPRHQSIPVVFLSGHIDEWSGTALGAEIVLRKPVRPEALLATVAMFTSPRESPANVG